MSTFDELTERIDTLLHGYSVNQESTTWLTTSVTTSDTTLTVFDASMMGRGYIQVGDEMMYVANVNQASNTVTLAPWGRGQRGTTTAAHDANDKVTIAPLFPRAEIKKAINDVLNSMYPQVFGIGQTDFPFIAAQTTYDLPDDVQDIISVTYKVIGPSQEWFPARAWQLDRVADPTQYGTNGQLGKTLSLYTSPTPGQSVNVVYTKRPTLFTAGSQEFTTQTGLPGYAEDVVIYGAAFRMISFLDPSRLGALSAEADLVDNQRGGRSGESASRFLYNIYQQRLNEVADNMRRQYPVRSHYQR